MEMLNNQNYWGDRFSSPKDACYQKWLVHWRLDYSQENVMLKVDTDKQNRHWQRWVNENYHYANLLSTIFPLVETVKLEVT